jgi:hypothetical protein
MTKEERHDIVCWLANQYLDRYTRPELEQAVFSLIYDELLPLSENELTIKAARFRLETTGDK